MGKIMVLGNYKPSKHACGKIHHIDGISSTVMENHGAVICIMEVKEYEKNLLWHRPFEGQERQGR